MQANYSEAELLTFISKFRKRRKIRRRSLKPSEKSETRHFYVVVMQRRQRNVKKACCKCRVVVLPVQPIAFFCRSRCRRRCGIFKRSIVQHSVQMMEQCCSLSKRCRNNPRTIGRCIRWSVDIWFQRNICNRQNTMISLLDCQIFNILTYSSVPSKVSRVINVSAVP